MAKAQDAANDTYTKPTRPTGWASLAQEKQAVADSIPLLVDTPPAKGETKIAEEMDALLKPDDSSATTRAYIGPAPAAPPPVVATAMTAVDIFNAVEMAADDLAAKELAVTAARGVLTAKVAAIDDIFAWFDVAHIGDIEYVADPTSPTRYRKARVANEDTLIGGRS